MISAAGRAFLASALADHRALDPELVRHAAAAVRDWPAVANTAEDAAIGAFVWNGLTAARLDTLLPADLLESLRDVAERTAAHAAVALASGRRLARVLRSGNVDVLALKGLGLLLREPTYGAVRHLDDIDVMVRATDLAVVDEVLRAAGYLRLEARIGERGGIQAFLDANPAVHHAVSYRDHAGLLIEVHHRPPEDLPSSVEGIWARSEPAPGGPPNLRIPSLEDAFGIACRHVLEHHAGDDRYVYRLVADLRLLLALGADVSLARVLHDRPGAAPVEAGLALLRDASGLRERASVGGRARRHGRALRTYGWRYLLPSPTFLANRYGVSPRTPLLPILYVRRALEAAWALLVGPRP